MNWLYIIWSFGFTTGRIYGNKGAGWKDEKPLYVSDLKRFLAQLNQHKSRGFNSYLRKHVAKLIDEEEK